MFITPSLKLNTRKIAAPLFALFAACLIILSVSIPRAMANSGAESFVKSIGTKVLGVMSSSASDSAKKAKFKSLFVNYTDTRRIGTFALGKYARSIGGKRAEYDRLLKDYVVNVYYGHLKGYKGKSVHIKKSIDRGREVIVDSNFKFTNRADVPIKWRVLKTGGGYKIFDVNVAGVWLAIEQKSVFNSVISKNGGKVDSIINFMKKQTAKAG